MPGRASQAASFSTAFHVQRRRPLLVALAGDVEDAVLAVGAEIPHAELDQLADAAGGIGQHGEHGLVADADRDQLCFA